MAISSNEWKLLEVALASKNVQQFALTVYKTDVILDAIKALLLKECDFTKDVKPQVDDITEHRDAVLPIVPVVLPNRKRKRKERPANPDFKCMDCGKEFYTESHLRIHTFLHKPIDERPFYCVDCNFGTTDQWKFNRHNMSKNHFITVGTIVKTPKEKPVKLCEYCDYKTSSSNQLKRHMRKHNGSRPYTCQYCSYSASQNSTLARHILTHTGEKPFKCKQCDFAAADTKSLRHHTLQQHGDTVNSVLFPCELCNYKTRVERYFRLHMTTHSNERPHLCHICGYAGKRSHTLIKHYRSIHGAEIPAKKNTGKQALLSSDNVTVKISDSSQEVTNKSAARVDNSEKQNPVKDAPATANVGTVTSAIAVQVAEYLSTSNSHEQVFADSLMDPSLIQVSRAKKFSQVLPNTQPADAMLFTTATDNHPATTTTTVTCKIEDC